MRSERYRDILPTQRLESARVTIVGVGAIGRQAALQLAAMGVGALQLIDHDTVDPANLGTQGYRHGDVGAPKVEATAEATHGLNPAVELDTRAERYARSMRTEPIVFCCVDSIETRRHIFEAVETSADLFVDGRMTAEALRVLTIDTLEARERYRGTLFEPAEALSEGCTSRSTLYCASIAAGLMVGQFSRHLRSMPPDFDVVFNILAAELSVA